MGSASSPPQGQNFGRLFSYPQGVVSFLPSVLALAALASNFLTFPEYAFGAGDFMCFQVEIGSSSSSGYSCDPSWSSCRRNLGGGTLQYDCDGLYLVQPQYWDDSDDKQRYVPIQIAALLGILATTIGFVAFSILFSGSCFELGPRKLLWVAIAHIVCACCSLLTIFVAGFFDPCKDIDNCDRHHFTGVRLQQGAVAAIFATFFYIWATIAVFQYRAWVLRVSAESHHSTEQQEEEEAMHLMESAPQTTSEGGSNPKRTVVSTSTRTETKLIPPQPYD